MEFQHNCCDSTVGEEDIVEDLNDPNYYSNNNIQSISTMIPSPAATIESAEETLIPNAPPPQQIEKREEEPSSTVVTTTARGGTATAISSSDDDDNDDEVYVSVEEGGEEDYNRNDRENEIILVDDHVESVYRSTISEGIVNCLEEESEVVILPLSNENFVKGRGR